MTYGAGISQFSEAESAAGTPCSKAPREHESAACMCRRAKQEKRQPRRQPQPLQQQQQERAQAPGVRVRSRASAARRDAPRAAEEPEYKKVYKPRVRSQVSGNADHTHGVHVLPMAGW